MTKQLLKNTYCLVAFVVLGMGSAFAQSITGSIKDTQGNALIGASVMIKGTIKGAAADLNGKYTIANVAAGTYTLTATFVGYKSVKQSVTVGTGVATSNFVLQDDALEMDALIVTGAFDQRTKLESSVAITTLTPKNIEQRAARSTGDLLQSVPGIWVDNSSGEVGSKVVARGVAPVGNDQVGFQYISLQEEGLPVMGAQMGFSLVDMYQRVDITTARMEAIRGGSSSITSANSPGGIFNFISKTGGSKFEGSARMQAGIYNNNNNFTRFDAEFGGPLVKGWAYNIGGFYRTDEGARSTPFKANVGGQIKANITKQIGKGMLKIYGKLLNDQNTFFKEIALANNLETGYAGGVDAVDINNSTTFIDINTAMPNTLELRKGTPINNYRIFDAKKGIQNNSKSAGVDYKTELGSGWSLEAKAKYSTFDQDYLQYQGNVVIPTVPSLIVPNNLGYLQFGAGALASASTYTGAGVPASLAGTLASSFFPSVLSPTYTDTRTGGVLAKVNFALAGGAPIGVLDPNVPNKLGKYLLATVPLNMYNQTTDQIASININKELGNHQMTFGTFYSKTSINTQWFADGVISTLGANPSAVNITFPQPAALPAAIAGIPSLAGAFGGLYGSGRFQATDPSGIILHGGLAYTVTENTSTLNAFYFNDVWKATNKLTLDLGIRYETVRHTGQKQGWQGGTAFGGLGGIDGNQLTTYDLGSRAYNGRVFKYDNTYDAAGNVTNSDAAGDGDGFQFNYVSWSLGGNYKMSDKTAIYGRVSRGNKAPELDYYANNFVNIPLDKKGALETVTQGEIGFKTSSQKASVSLTGFYSYLDNALLQLFISNGSNSFFTDATFNASRTVGLEIETSFRPTNDFTIKAHATIQSAKYARLTYQNTAGSTDRANFFEENFAGNRVKDVAPVIIDITPTYRVGKFSPYINYRWFSERSGNRRNTIDLAAYGVLGAGITGDLTSKLSVAIQANNLLNSAGILLFGGYGLQGTTAEDIAIGGVINPKTNLPLANTDLNVLNTLASPVFARPILARQLSFSLTLKF